MITEWTAGSVYPSAAAAPVSPMGALTHDPVMYGAIEQRSESPGPFGPIRTVRRMFHSETAAAMGTARRLNESQEECQHMMTQMRRLYEHVEQREVWWRKGIESMEMHVSERVQERDRLLDISQREWSVKDLEMQNAAAAANR